MKTTTQFSRRGVSHTPQLHTPQLHTPQSHTPQSHTPQSHTPQSHTPQSHTPQSHTPHHRRSIRLKGYDYSADGIYFITICTKNRQNLFGHIADGEMVLNETGQIVKSEWLNTVNVRQGEVILHDFVVMPNHFHAIIEICRRRGVSNTPLSNTPLSHASLSHASLSNTSLSNTSLSNTSLSHTPNNGVCDTTEGVCDTPLRSPSKSLGAIVRGFKSAVSKKIGFSVWQRNYHEHIIRDSRGFEKISKYIRNNPACWDMNRFHN